MVIFQLYGEKTTLDWFLRKLARLYGSTDVIILFDFGFNILGVSDLQVVEISIFALTLLIIVYNSAAASAQRVIVLSVM